MSILRTLQFIIKHPLNKQNKIQALIKFLKWQAGSRLLSYPIVYSWIDGTRVIVRHGDTGFTGNIYCGLHECPEMAFALHILRPDDLFVDVGSNIGSYSILACGARKARGYCFEPVPETYRRLLDNIHINNLEGRVKAFNLGVSDKDDELFFTSGEDTINHVVASSEACESSIRVKVGTLDSILGDECPFLIKIDVEGFETRVIDGASSTLNNPALTSVIMELNGSGSRYGYDENAILKKMKDYGFKTYSYDPFTRTLKSLAGSIITTENSLFIRDEELVQDRIASAPYTLVGNVRL